MIVEREFEVNGILLSLEADVSRYYPATMYAKNGDPGDPEEGGEIEELSIWLGDTDITEIVSMAVIKEAEEIAYTVAEAMEQGY